MWILSFYSLYFSLKIISWLRQTYDPIEGEESNTENKSRKRKEKKLRMKYVPSMRILTASPGMWCANQMSGCNCYMFAMPWIASMLVRMTSQRGFTYLLQKSSSCALVTCDLKSRSMSCTRHLTGNLWFNGLLIISWTATVLDH